MRTLYLRNVPDEVVERLEERAKTESISVNALAVRELAEVSRRFNNRALFAAAPRLDVSTQDIVETIREMRGE